MLYNRSVTRNEIGLRFSARYTRIRLCVLRKHLPDEDATTCNTQGHFLDIAIGDINTELELLHRYDIVQEERRSENPYHWTGTLVELVELIYGLQEARCIDDGRNDIKALAAFFGELFGMEIKVRNCYDAYLDMKRRKNDSCTYFLDKMRERLNLRMQHDDEKEQARRR